MNILVSQNSPTNVAPFVALKEKYNADVVFRPFFLIEPLSAKEFRAQRINLPDYSAVVFSSRHAIDAYFKLCEELRFKVPETMKYFCTTELVAIYLQKHVVYRKRKIFFGDGTPSSIIASIGSKHKGEKFLITTSAESSGSAITSQFDQAGLEYTTAVLVKSVPQDLSDLKLDDYDAFVFHNSADVKSLFANFPDFKQGDMNFISFGKGVVSSMEEAGLKITVQAPTPEIPSVVKAVEVFLTKK